MRLLRRIIGKCYEEVLDDGLSVPEPPMWRKTNNPQQWWNPNDYEILSATFRHEVGACLKVYSSYLPKEESKPESATPRKSVNLQLTISGLLTPKKPRNVTFP